MISARYWQLRILETNGNDSALTDLELSNYPHTANLIPLATVSTISSTLFHYEFADPQIVGAYSFTANGLSAPKSFVIEHSDDNQHWTLAHIEHSQRDWLNERRHFVVELFELSLSLNGSNAARWFNAFIHNRHGELILSKQVFNGTTAILMPDAQHVSVTVTQECGTVWEASKTYFIDDFVFPTDTTATPYYYRNRKTMLSGNSEPTWSTNPEILTHDGGCVWELIERFNQPITQFPLIPSRKIP